MGHLPVCYKHLSFPSSLGKPSPPPPNTHTSYLFIYFILNKGHRLGGGSCGQDKTQSLLCHWIFYPIFFSDICPKYQLLNSLKYFILNDFNMKGGTSQPWRTEERN